MMRKNIPNDWPYSVKHVFPVKEVSLEMYTSNFNVLEFENYREWKSLIDRQGYTHLRFYMVTLRNDGRSGLRGETYCVPRAYNVIYPPTTLNYLKRGLKPKLLKKPVDEKDWPGVGRLMRLARYNFWVYLILKELLV